MDALSLNVLTDNLGRCRGEINGLCYATKVHERYDIIYDVNML
jgi:hypothetical protein